MAVAAVPLLMHTVWQCAGWPCGYPAVVVPIRVAAAASATASAGRVNVTPGTQCVW